MHFSAGSAVMAGSQGLSRHEKRRKGGWFFLTLHKVLCVYCLGSGTINIGWNLQQDCQPFSDCSCPVATIQCIYSGTGYIYLPFKKGCF